jgi:hypothetical protein
MTLTTELAEKVEAIYRENLEKEFGDSLAFDPISVEPTEDSEGQDTFRVTIVYEAQNKGERPQAKKMVTVMTAVFEPLENLGIRTTMIESYVPKHEYPALLEMRAEPPWGVQEE